MDGAAEGVDGAAEDADGAAEGVDGAAEDADGAVEGVDGAVEDADGMKGGIIMFNPIKIKQGDIKLGRKQRRHGMKVRNDKICPIEKGWGNGKKWDEKEI